MTKKLMIVLMMFFVLIGFSNSYAAVEVFSNYNTKISLTNEDTLLVKKEVFLRNIHEVGIVPGEVEFKIRGLNNDDLTLKSYSIKDRYGKEIKSETRTTDDATYIIINIFTPLLPGFEYKIDLEYELEVESKGLLFKTIQLPLKETTKIPIQNGIYEFEIPSKYNVNYVSFKENSTVVEDNAVSWEISRQTPDFVEVEYSYIPLRFEGVRTSIVFWLGINIILIFILLLSVIKEVKKIKTKN